MGFIVAVSAFIIPLIIFYVVVDGMIHERMSMSIC